MFCCSSPAGQNFSIFEKKKKIDHVIELIYMPRGSSQMALCGSVWKSFQAALCYSGPESLTVPRRKLIVKVRGGQVLRE